MSIWGTTPVSEQPALTLTGWRVFEADGTRHFAGWCVENQEGRVSSAIADFDAETMLGLTTSGRAYQLVGPPGLNREAEYVMSRWLDFNNIASVKQLSTEEI